MICVIPFCSKDAHLALNLAQWIKQLGGVRDHACLLAVDHGVDWTNALEVRRLAGEAFRTVEIIASASPVEGWIPGSCALMRMALEHCAGNPFFWLEPDAVPLKASWLSDIEAAYKNATKPFLGALVTHQNPLWPNPYLEGCAVYPPDAWQRMKATFKADVSWTKACAPVVVPEALSSTLIQHLWGEVGNPPTFAEVGVPKTASFGLSQIDPKAAVFHRNKDKTLIELLRQKHGFSQRKAFCHGGDMGDVIYGLCAIRAAGGGQLFLVPHQVRRAFSAQNAREILPLLEIQPYLTTASFHDCPVIPFNSGQKPPFIDHDLNKFRVVQFQRRHQGLWENIAQTHLRILDLDLSLANKGPWLFVDKPTVIPGKPVVFSRSLRYNNRYFPWGKYMKENFGKAVFVGLEIEHRAFVGKFGGIPFHRTENLLELARVIAGAELFIGNQSAPYAIAEGLKQNAILEASPQVPDCFFKRDNLEIIRR